MLANQRHLFSLPEDLIYLNHAYMSPNLKSVEQAGIRGIERKNIPSLMTVDDFFNDGDQVRHLFSELIESPEPTRIAIIPSVSYGMANAAQNIEFKPGNGILMVGEQFPSNYYIWDRRAKETGAKIKILSAPIIDLERGKTWNQHILEAINEETKVVTMPIVHWADGTLFDLAAIRKRTLEVGAYLLIDGTQSIGALPFSIADCPVDALICGSYKWLMGPYGLGVAYYGPRYDQGKPIEESWINRKGSEDFSRLVDYSDNYRPGARRYEVGEASNFILLPMMKAGLEQLLNWGVENIQAYTKSISSGTIDLLRGNGFWVEEQAYRSSHLFGIRLPHGQDMDQVKDKINIHQIKVSYRGDAIRVSPHVYSSEDDFKRLSTALIAQ